MNLNAFQLAGNLDLIQHMHRTNQFKAKKGLDPGHKLMVGGVSLVSILINFVYITVQTPIVVFVYA